ncbi:hypothetical protein GOV05_03650 [Candidatus Woesearchaeota archaeon]|nr:hypothetical protein [Candidatus Woesearchaeota archaeon]
MGGKKKSLIFLIVLLILFSCSVLGVNDILNVKIDKSTYKPNETITVSGELYASGGAIQGVNVTITLDNTTYYVATDSNGEFTKTLAAPSQGITM